MGAMVSASGRRRSTSGLENTVGDLAKNVHTNSLEVTCPPSCCTCVVPCPELTWAIPLPESSIL
eukprot:1851887-Rhodomonas_salina.1